MPFFPNHFLETSSTFIATLLTKTTFASYTNSSFHQYYPHCVFTCTDILYKQTHIQYICDLLLKHQGYLVFFRISCEDQHWVLSQAQAPCHLLLQEIKSLWQPAKRHHISDEWSAEWYSQGITVLWRAMESAKEEKNNASQLSECIMVLHFQSIKAVSETGFCFD